MSLSEEDLKRQVSSSGGSQVWDQRVKKLESATANLCHGQFTSWRCSSQVCTEVIPLRCRYLVEMGFALEKKDCSLEELATQA